ncbi:M16 family metallopeptidase [Streptomyces celluloflavus]|uniref:M16 family metallopeptidase n=1 Tax=Streptomyces celluloflavus TaxID=58344 RepID=A0ABW7RMK4_9ACTN
MAVRPGSGIVCATLAIASGSATDPEGLPGCAHFTEHAFFSGSRRLPSAAVVAEVIGALGGVFDAVTHRDYALFHIKAPAGTERAILDIVSDLRLHPLLSDREMDKQRSAVQHEIRMFGEQSQRGVRELAGLALYGDTPVGRSPLGDSRVIDRLTVDHARQFLEHAAGPERTALVVVGDVDEKSVTALARDTLGQETRREDRWSRANGSFLPPASLWRTMASRGVVGCWAVPGVGYTATHREMQCLRLFNTVVGGSASSRLSQKIRDEQGLSYRVRSILEPLADVGGLLTLFTCELDGLRQILSTVRDVLDEALTDGISDRELARARAMTKGIYAREREDSAVHARLLALELFRRGRFTSQHGESSLLDSISAEEVVDVARRTLSADAGRCAVVGPDVSVADLPKLGHEWAVSPLHPRPDRL